MPKLLITSGHDLSILELEKLKSRAFDEIKIDRSLTQGFYIAHH